MGDREIRRQGQSSRRVVKLCSRSSSFGTKNEMSPLPETFLRIIG